MKRGYLLDWMEEHDEVYPPDDADEYEQMRQEREDAAYNRHIDSWRER